MVSIELNEEECMTLKYLLENCLADLRMEIIQTDSIDYKTMLKKRKAVLLKLQKSIMTTGEQTERIIE
ncbi:MAG: hypothetical protein CVU46_11880 [Chloroflexi bacterium HGW-Chloroflexi-8]|nr:MAG: hypothetical protein CVU46_11880 [Chloroflexi bacterium HGW-Chloroflexi-8]